MSDSSSIFHLGEEKKIKGAIAPPIFRTSNFAFDSIAQFKKAIENEKDHSVYSRGNNPTVRLLEQKLAALQGTEDALCFASGSAAVAAAIMANIQQGDHVISVMHTYSWTKHLFNYFLAHFGVEVSYFDGTQPDQLKSLIKPNTKVLFLESPTSFNLELQPLKEYVQLAQERGVMTISDSTYASVLSKRHAEIGIDLICHSASKFIGGHSDAVAGVICGSKERIAHVFRHSYMTFGALMTADTASLLIRSLRTIDMRISHSATSTQKVVAFLKNHPKIERIVWPFDETHPQHVWCADQMTRPIPLIGFYLKSQRREDAILFCDHLTIPQIAVSWGGHESLVMPAAALDNVPFQANYIRFYIGFENAEELIADLNQALAQLQD